MGRKAKWPPTIRHRKGGDKMKIPLGKGAFRRIRKALNVVRETEMVFPVSREVVLERDGYCLSPTETMRMVREEQRRTRKS